MATSPVTLKTLTAKLTALQGQMKQADPETHRTRLEKARAEFQEWLKQHPHDPRIPNQEKSRRLAELGKLEDTYNRARSAASYLEPDIAFLERITGAPEALKIARAEYTEAELALKEAQGNVTAAPQAVAHVAALLAAAQAEHAKATAAAASGLLAQVKAGGKPDVPTLDRSGLDVLAEAHGAALAEQKRCDEELAQAQERFSEAKHVLKCAELFEAELQLECAIPAILAPLSRVFGLHRSVRSSELDIGKLLVQRMREAEGSEA